MLALENHNPASLRSNIKLVPAVPEEYASSAGDPGSDSSYDEVQPESIDQPWAYVFPGRYFQGCTICQAIDILQKAWRQCLDKIMRKMAPRQNMG